MGQNVEVGEDLKALAEQSSKYFDGDTLREFVYLRTYAKWIEEKGRREFWPETVQRYMNFMREHLVRS